MNAEAIRARLMLENLGSLDEALDHACRALSYVGHDVVTLARDVSAGYVRRPPPAPVRPAKTVPEPLDIPSEQAP